MTLHDLFASLETRIQDADQAELPAFIGRLAQLQATAQLRIVTGQESAKGGKDDLLEIPEVAQRLKVSTYRAYQLARQGVLPSIKLGKSVRVKPSALADYLGKRGG